MKALFVLIGVMLLFSFTPFEKEAKESEEGRHKYEQGDMENAEKEFEKASRRLKKSPEAYFDLGNSRLKAGKNEEALDAYRKSLETGKADRSLRSGIYHNMGNTFAKMGKLNDAEKMFVKSLVEEPSKESAENLEIVRRMIKQQEKQKQQQQQNKDQQNNEDQQDQDQQEKQTEEQQNREEQGNKNQQEEPKQTEDKEQQKEQKKAEKKDQDQQEKKQAALAEKKEEKDEEKKEKGQLLKQFKQRKNLQISPFMLQREGESESGQTW